MDVPHPPDPLPTGPPEGSLTQITTVMAKQLGPYTDLAVVFGCECHGYDYRHWGRQCSN